MHLMVGVIRVATTLIFYESKSAYVMRMLSGSYDIKMKTIQSARSTPGSWNVAADQTPVTKTLVSLGSSRA